jgi:transposase
MQLVSDSNFTFCYIFEEKAQFTPGKEVPKFIPNADIKAPIIPSVKLKLSGRCVKTIHHYISAYKEKGLDGLEITYSPDAPTKLTSEEKQQLIETIAYQQPVDVGFPAKYNWILSLVTQYIKREWGQSYTLRGASKLLHSLGLSYTRPTYTLKKADKEKQDEFALETFPALKKSF